MTPATAYARRLKHAVARASEVVSLSRTVSGAAQTVTIQPLVVPATAAVETAVASGQSATPTPAEQYAGFAAQAGAGESLTVPDSASTATKKTVVPVLMLVQDVSQSPAAVGDTFPRDGQTWTVRSVTNQLLAGQFLAVLSLADASTTSPQ